MSDVRRCRRCKRKRMDDEPPEVRLYKTCAKCRIIERQKKKLRKPLAEETMIYGMKQFQQQSIAGDDIFMDDEIFDGKPSIPSNEPANPSQQQFSLYKFQSTSVPPSSGSFSTGTNLHTLPPQTVSLHNAGAQNFVKVHPEARIDPVRTSRYETILTNNVSMPKASMPYKPPLNCEICSTKLDLNDEVSMNYGLCALCYTDPFKSKDVFGNFDEFLSAIQKNRHLNIENFVFVKKLESDFNDSLNTNKNVANEKQYRDLILDNIKIIFLDPVIASVIQKFNQVSTNTNDPNLVACNFRGSSSIKCWYKCYKDSQLNCKSSLYLNYNLNYNLVIIKLSHHMHEISRKYTQEFVNIVEGIIAELKNDSTQKNVGYNFATGHLVYDRLVSRASTFDPETQNIVRYLNSEDFVSDFINFVEVLKQVDENKKKSSEVSNGNGNVTKLITRADESGDQFEASNTANDDDDEDLEAEVDEEDEEEEDDDEEDEEEGETDDNDDDENNDKETPHGEPADFTNSIVEKSEAGSAISEELMSNSNQLPEAPLTSSESSGAVAGAGIDVYSTFASPSTATKETAPTQLGTSSLPVSTNLDPVFNH